MKSCCHWLPVIACALLLAGCAGQQSASDADAHHLTLQTRLHLAAVATRDGADGLALSMYQKAAAAAPDSAEAQARYADALASAGQVDRAEGVLSAALKRDGNKPRLLLARARLSLLLGHPGDALTDCKSVLARKPADLHALSDQGVALDMLGKHAEAQASYRKVLAVTPDDTAAVNDLALSLLLSGQARQAVALLSPIAAHPDASPRTRGNLAVALAAAGQQTEAQQMVPADASQAELMQLAAAAGHGGSAGAAGAHPAELPAAGPAPAIE